MLINWANQDKLQRFPNVGGVGFAPWDVLRQRASGTAANQLTLDDMAKNAGSVVMYCPSANAPERDPFSAYDYAAIDYLLLVGEPKKGPNLIVENSALPNTYHNDRIRSVYTTISPAGGKTEVGASQRELVVDALGVKGSSWDVVTDNLKKAFTNHLDGTKGAGAHIGFVDGHVAWRSRADMERMSGSTTPVKRFNAFSGVIFTW
jgi:prepilin-type processing-associated H-X9-DG protein